MQLYLCDVVNQLGHGIRCDVQQHNQFYISPGELHHPRRER